MPNWTYRSATLASVSCVALLASNAYAQDFNIPRGDLGAALDAYARQTGVALIVSGDAIRGTRTQGANGSLTIDSALVRWPSFGKSLRLTKAR